MLLARDCYTIKQTWCCVLHDTSGMMLPCKIINQVKRTLTFSWSTWSWKKRSDHLQTSVTRDSKSLTNTQSETKSLRRSLTNPSFEFLLRIVPGRNVKQLRIKHTAHTSSQHNQRASRVTFYAFDRDGNINCDRGHSHCLARLHFWWELFSSGMHRLSLSRTASSNLVHWLITNPLAAVPPTSTDFPFDRAHSCLATSQDVPPRPFPWNPEPGTGTPFNY